MPDAMAVKAAAWKYGKKYVHADEHGRIHVFCGHAKRFSYRTHSIEYRTVFFDSLDEVRLLEDEIERRGLLEQYESQLLRMWQASLDPSLGPTKTHSAFMLRATAAQRLEAVCAVIDQEARNV